MRELSITPPEFFNLSKAEQVRYLQALWDEISQNSDDIPVPENHLRIAEARLIRFQKDPAGARPAVEILDRLKDK